MTERGGESARSMLGVDLGTTHCKAGLFDLDGSVRRIAARPTPRGQDAEGHSCHDPEAMWEAAAVTIREAIGDTGGRDVVSIGVAGMSEAGLLVDRRTGAPRSEIVPWFDPRSTEQAEMIAREDAPEALFERTGLRPSFKYGLAKILWLRARHPEVLADTVWLSVPDYVVYRLTGSMVTDPTLAARTYAYRIGEGCWDDGWIRHFDLDPDMFPEVLPSGTPAGPVVDEVVDALGLGTAPPAAVAGHDHICALPAAGISAPGRVLDSVGTAESVLGVLPRLLWDRATFESGLTIVPHVLPGLYCWLGGTPAAGGSVEWLRAQLGEQPLPYERMDALAAEAGDEPTGILWFPYLSGSGAPAHDLHVRAALIGLANHHGRGHLVRAVLEGTAYEFESIRRAAEALTGTPITEIVEVGGGARNDRWVRIKASVSGCGCVRPAIPDATLLGAAMLAAHGAGALSLPEIDRIATFDREQGDIIEPDSGLHQAYRHIYEEQYAPFNIFLRQTP